MAVARRLSPTCFCVLLKQSPPLTRANVRSGSEIRVYVLGGYKRGPPRKGGFLRNQLHKGTESGPDGRDASSQPGRYSWDGRTLIPTGLGNQINQLADVSVVNRASNTSIGVLLCL